MSFAASLTQETLVKLQGTPTSSWIVRMRRLETSVTELEIWGLPLIAVFVLLTPMGIFFFKSSPSWEDKDYYFRALTVENVGGMPQGCSPRGRRGERG